MNAWQVPRPPPPRPPFLPRGMAALASGLLYVAACATPALYIRADDGALETFWGAYCAALGVFALLILCPAWLANVFGLVAMACVLTRKYKVGIAFAAMSVALALSTFVLFAVQVPLDEGGVRNGHLAAPGPGFYLWTLSLASLGAAAVWLRAREKRG